MSNTFVSIAGALIEARGIPTEESSDILQLMTGVLDICDDYITSREHEFIVNELRGQIVAHLEEIAIYRLRQKQCSAGGCLDTETTEEVFSEVLGATVLLCKTHRNRIDGAH